MTIEAQSLFGLGLYSISDVARYIGSEPQKVKRWVAGHTYPYRDHRHTSQPVIQTTLEQTDEENVLTFLDLIELRFVAEFRKHEVSLQTIRVCARRAAERYDTQHPFATRRFATDGRTIFTILEGEGDKPDGISMRRYTEDLLTQGGVFEEFVRRFFVAQIEPDEEEWFARRWYPLGKEKRVVLDPARAFGKPIDSETGVPTSVLYDSTKSDETVDDIAAWYEVPVDAVVQAIEYEKSLLIA